MKELYQLQCLDIKIFPSCRMSNIKSIGQRLNIYHLTLEHLLNDDGCTKLLERFQPPSARSKDVLNDIAVNYQDLSEMVGG